MNNTMLVGLPEIASFLRCSVRKLHDPKIKKEMIDKRIIFERKGNFGQKVWVAFQNDLVNYVKEKATAGDPF